MDLVFLDHSVKVLIESADSHKYDIQELIVESLIKLREFEQINFSSMLPCSKLLIDQNFQEKFQEMFLSCTFLFNSEIVAACTSLNYIDLLFLLKPSCSECAFLVYPVEIAKLCGTSIEKYVKMIENQRVSYKRLFSFYQSFMLYKKLLKSQCKNITSKGEALINVCQGFKQELKIKKKQIVKRFKKLKGYEVILHGVECSNCKSNLKEVLNLPCGHFDNCGECMLSYFKILPNLPISRSDFKCSRCHELVCQTLIYSKGSLT